MQFSPEETDRILRARRSVFAADYTGESIPLTTIRKILEHATLAPTHKRTEPWRFVVFHGPGRARLAELQSECYRRVTQANQTFKEERYKGLQNKPFDSACIIALGMKRDPKASVPEVEELGAVFCAIENMYLSATSMGVGCYISTGGITYFKEAKELFGLGPEDKLLGFFHLGIPRQTSPAWSRKPVDEVTTWVTE